MSSSHPLKTEHSAFPESFSSWMTVALIALGCLFAGWYVYAGCRWATDRANRTQCADNPNSSALLSISITTSTDPCRPCASGQARDSSAQLAGPPSAIPAARGRLCTIPLRPTMGRAEQPAVVSPIAWLRQLAVQRLPLLERLRLSLREHELYGGHRQRNRLADGDPVRLPDIASPAETIVVVEVANSDVRWSEPRDLTVAEAIQLAGSNHVEGMNVLMVDGSVRFFAA